MKIGYARVSTYEQNLDLQIDALRAVGIEEAHMHKDKLSDTKDDRPGLAEAMRYLRPGDVFYVWRLDRLGRTMKGIIERVNAPNERGVEFVSLQENIDTTNLAGEFIFHVFAALAELERDLIRQRTQAGLSAARARGRLGGRRPSLTPAQVRQAAALMKDQSNSPQEIADTFKISLSTLYRYVSPKGEIRKSI
jgi:DNA invertase Pin-like site-specific DNA recombinase